MKIVETHLSEQITRPTTRPVLQTDENDFIISDTDEKKIGENWGKTLEEIKAIHLDRIGEENVHSIYVTGSVARGLARPGESDIDIVTIVHKRSEKINDAWINEKLTEVNATKKDLSKKYKDPTKFDFQIIPYDDITDEERDFYQRFILKVYGVCIYPEDGSRDVTKTIPPFKLDERTQREFATGLGGSIKKAKRRMELTKDDVGMKGRCAWIMKKIVRTGFALVMDKDRVFTTDLQPSYEYFSKHYPEQEQNMKRALELAENPISNKEEINRFLDAFGVWLKEEVDRKFPPNIETKETAA